jgi:hypothetical protein
VVCDYRIPLSILEFVFSLVHRILQRFSVLIFIPGAEEWDIHHVKSFGLEAVDYMGVKLRSVGD